MADKLIVDADTGETTTVPLTAEEQAERDAMAVEYEQQRQAEGTRTANRQTIEDAARKALASNRTYLGLSSPTNAQNAAQLKALTRQVNGLIRLALSELDAAD